MKIRKEDALRIKHKSKIYEVEGCPDLPQILYDDDVLTINGNGTYTKHTGICRTRIIIPDGDIEKWDKDCYLEML